MDGIHDLGGKQGYGAVLREVDEPVFHDRWEAAIFTMTRTARACGALQNTDQFRHAIERISPVAYLTHGYYGRWLGGLENLLTEAGVITSPELNERAAALGGNVDALVAAQPDPAFAPFANPPREDARREIANPPKLAVGQEIRTSSATTSGHTRLPAYARNRRGTIVAHHDGWVYPDTNAHGKGEMPTHLYTVAFSGDELWGPDAEPHTVVYLDLFEPYLELIDE
jgi:nitrile hydratase